MISEDVSTSGADSVPNPTVAALSHAILIHQGELGGRDVGRVQLDFGVGQEDGLHGAMADAMGTICAFQLINNLVAQWRGAAVGGGHSGVGSSSGIYAVGYSLKGAGTGWSATILLVRQLHDVGSE